MHANVTKISATLKFAKEEKDKHIVKKSEYAYLDKKEKSDE